MWIKNPDNQLQSSMFDNLQQTYCNLRVSGCTSFPSLKRGSNSWLWRWKVLILERLRHQNYKHCHKVSNMTYLGDIHCSWPYNFSTCTTRPCNSDHHQPKSYNLGADQHTVRSYHNFSCTFLAEGLPHHYSRYHLPRLDTIRLHQNKSLGNKNTKIQCSNLAINTGRRIEFHCQGGCELWRENFALNFHALIILHFISYQAKTNCIIVLMSLLQSSKSNLLWCLPSFIARTFSDLRARCNSSFLFFITART